MRTLALLSFLATPPTRDLGRAEEPVALRGQLRGVAPEELAAAEVWLVASIPWRADGEVNVVGRPALAPDGAFEFQVTTSELQTLAARSLAFWAWAAGHQLGKVTLNAFQPPNGAPLVVTLDLLDDGSTITLVDSAGAPIAGARVTPRMVGADGWTPPAEFCSRAAATTAADGIACLPLVRAKELGSVRIDCVDGAIVDAGWSNGSSHRTTITLPPTVAAELELTADGRPWPQDREVELVTRTVPRNEITLVVRRRARTDAAGRLRLADLAAGELEIVATPDAAFPWQFGGRTKVAADAPARFTLAATRVAEVVGRLQGDDGSPIAGAEVAFAQVGAPPVELVTDEGGRCRAWLDPAKAPTLNVRRVPPPWFIPMPPPTTALAPAVAAAATAAASAARHELPPLVLPRGRAIRGAVVDDDGQPVAGAWVQLAVPDDDMRTGRFRWPWVTVADASGAFELVGVDTDIDWQISAQLLTAKLDPPLAVAIGSDDIDTGDLALRVPKPTVGPSGACPEIEVVDAAGKPIAGADAVLWRRSLDPQYGMELEREERETPAGRIAATDADGRTRHPQPVPAGSSFRFVVGAAGHAPAMTPWIAVPADAAATDAPPLQRVTLAPLARVTGRVIDRGGKPIAGARVRQAGDGPRPTTATCDADGRFTLAGYEPGRGFVIADATGFRTSGLALVAPAADVVVTLARREEPPLVARAANAGTDDPERRGAWRAASRRAAEELIAPSLEKARAAPDEGMNLRLLESWVQIDPGRGLRAIDAGLMPQAWFRDYARRPLVKQLARVDVEDALAVANAMETAQFRGTAFLDVIEAVPELPDERRRALLFDALQCARAEEAPAMRVVKLAHVAEAFREHGDSELGKRILAEATPTAQALASEEWEGYARGCVAEELAVVDLPAALALCDSLTDPFAYDRHRGNIAHEIAARDPAAAERVLGEMRQASFRDRIALRVAWRMAPVDPARARKIVAEIGGAAEALQGRLFVAEQLARNDEFDAARAEVAAAFAAVAEAGPPQPRELVLAAAMLPQVAVAAPDEVDERMWELLAMRDAEREWASSTAGRMLRGDGLLAAALVGVAPDLARHLLARLEPWLVEALDGDGEEAGAALAAWAALDPAAARALLERALSRPDASPATTRRDYRRASLSGLLLRDGPEMVETMLSSALSRWIPDTEDL